MCSICVMLIILVLAFIACIISACFVAIAEAIQGFMRK